MQLGPLERSLQGLMQNSATAEKANTNELGLAGKFARTRDQLTLFALRAGATVSKFLLAIYTAHYLSLSDLGIYGLLLGGTVIVPAVAGLGLSDWIVRRIVDVPLAHALPLVSTRCALSILIQLVGQPLVLLGFLLAGRPLPLELALLCGAILLLETLANEICDVLIARQRILLANWLSFLRQGLWPLPVIALGVFVPQSRSLAVLLSFWAAALSLTLIILFLLLLQHGRWRHVRVRPHLLPGALRGSRLLYVKDVSGTFSAFADRFVISMFLGLELSGIYSLFWSIANVVHSLVVVGVMQTHLAPLILAAKERTGAEFRALERKLQLEAGSWALLFAGAAAALAPVLITSLQRPLMHEHLPVFWLILLATLLRIAADGYGYAVYAFHRDRAIASIAVGGALASAVLNLLLTPAAGLWGSALAYALTGAGLLAVRFIVTRLALRSSHDFHDDMKCGY
jgi:O-antigen/teichoic acid export membrane protein